MSAPPARGRLLVASPSLEDPNFHRSVVFLLAADEDGALGVVINRPSNTPVAEIVPQWRSLASSPPFLFVGGPVQPNAAICVGRAERLAGEVSPEQIDGEVDSGSELFEIDGFSPLTAELGTVDLHKDPDEIGVTFDGLRVFTGYAGWGPGQLEEEIEAGAWFVLECTEDDVLSDDPDGLWTRVLQRQGGWLRVLSHHPLDPSLN